LHSAILIHVAILDRDELSEYLRAVRSLALLAERSAEQVGLTLAQMRLLFTVSDLGEGSCSAVAARLHVSVSSVTRLIARPTMSALVSRAVSPTNASAVNLELTAEGASIVHRVTVHREQILRTALADVDVDSRTVAASVLARMTDRISAVVAS
jgi:DNA-binding MarR family transcriptional regulator